MDKTFYKKLYTWYETNRRDLPWRDTDDPYTIWISEIILQQTRVNQGIDYFHRFIAQFPTISVLANSNEQDVLHVWHGLGYYTRARNIYRTGQILHCQYNDHFPMSYAEIIKLPGIGVYTACAIMCFAYNRPFFAVDGNAIRVMARLYSISYYSETGEGKKIFNATATNLLDIRNPRLFNSAFMELGEVVCIPGKPKCEECPISAVCLAYQNKTISAFPLKKEKKEVIKRYFLYTVFIDKNHQTLIYQREGNDIWKHLYDFPVQEMEHLPCDTDYIHARHLLTHQCIEAYFTIREVEKLPQLDNCVKVDIEDIVKYPTSRLITKILPQIFVAIQTK